MAFCRNVIRSTKKCFQIVIDSECLADVYRFAQGQITWCALPYVPDKLIFESTTCPRYWREKRFSSTLTETS
jgi:hypothetical protein